MGGCAGESSEVAADEGLGDAQRDGQESVDDVDDAVVEFDVLGLVNHLRSRRIQADGLAYSSHDLVRSLESAGNDRGAIFSQTELEHLPASDVAAADLAIEHAGGVVEISMRELRNLCDLLRPNHAAVEVVSQSLLDQSGVRACFANAEDASFLEDRRETIIVGREECDVRLGCEVLRNVLVLTE